MPVTKEREAVISLITRRRPVRTYDDADLDEGTLDQVRNLLEAIPSGPFGNSSTFHLVRSGNDHRGRRIRLGTYGFISGAQWFVAGMARPAKGYLIDYGYRLEYIVLELTRLDLGTCWLGGTFSRSGFARSIGLDPGEEIPAVTPVGRPADKRNAKERLIRRIATADRRKATDELFCRESLKTRNPAILQALEMVRLAPSAENAQPWRIRRSGSFYNFYLRRSKGMLGTSLMQRLQEIDMGIAMAHWELSLREAGVSGRWELVGALEWEQPEDLEYVLSWKLD